MRLVRPVEVPDHGISNADRGFAHTVLERFVAEPDIADLNRRRTSDRALLREKGNCNQERGAECNAECWPRRIVQDEFIVPVMAPRAKEA